MTFTITGKGLKKLNKWKTERNRVAKKDGYTAHYTYSFTPTGLGIVIEVTDDTTLESINITDYESW